MFIKYQAVRNTVVGIALVIGGGFAALYLFGGNDAPAPATRTNPIVVADGAAQPVGRPTREAQDRRSTPNPEHSIPMSTPAARPRTETPPYSTTAATTSGAATPPTTEQERYLAAMKIATSSAAADGKGKDVLGAASPWKLNLYDDDNDGRWDRGKLDYDRDEVDDEKWNFKQGRWEKDGGATIWAGDRWIQNAGASKSALPTHTETTENANANANGKTASNSKLDRYREAMKAATSRATADGKGKDVLGASSPWKLNLYDDNKDGQWDRAKLDYNRDEVDDEKWNFKEGRWEKDGGDTIWNGNQWVPSD